MHPADAAFLRAIREQPDDDLPRLIYADYLDERGDPRGEFIRAQIERSTLPPGDPRRYELLAPERELLRWHEAEWLGPLAAVVSNHEFERGFIDWVLVMTEAFVAHAETIFAWAPVRRVKLRGALGWVKLLAAMPELAYLSEIDLRFDHLDAADGRLLAASPHLHRLTRLYLSGNHLGDEGALALAAAPALARLRALPLENCPLSATAVRALAGSPHLRDLHTLELSDNPLGDAGVRALVSAPFLRRFTALELTSTGLADGG